PAASPPRPRRVPGPALIPPAAAETDTAELNIYKKPPIYRQREHHPGAHHGKHLIEDLIIESSKFPAAQPPDPNQPAKIETDYWPCPPSLAVVETEWRRRMASKRGEEEEEDLSEEMKNLRELQRQELSKVTSNLGKLILKEEMEKSLPIRRKTRSLPDRTPFHTSLHMGSYKSSSLPASGRSTLTRVGG
ncbi:DEMA protein, partial [Crypturellus soui]|nr:DEMA protein [Crypturellus soui]